MSYCANAAGGCTSATVDPYGQAHACDQLRGHSGDHLCGCTLRWSA